MPSQLEQLKSFSTIAIETADIQAIHSLSNHVVISSTEILKLIKQSQHAALLQDAISDAKKHHWSSFNPAPKAVVSQLTTRLLKKILSTVTGHAFIELDVELAFDTEGLINQGRELYELFRHQLDSSRVVLSIPATWQGIAAARRLQRDRINTNLSFVYSFIQAQAGGDAGAFSLSAPVDTATNWYKNNEPGDYSEGNDPGVHTLTHFHTNLKYLGYSIKIIASGLGSLNQIRALAGADYLSLTPAQLQQLNQDQTSLERILDKAPEVFERPPEVTEKDFLWYLASNAMAYSQLGSDIRQRANEQRELEGFIKQTIETD